MEETNGDLRKIMGKTNGDLRKISVYTSGDSGYNINKVQLINVNSKMRKNLFYFLTKKGRTFPLVKISFFERY